MTSRGRLAASATWQSSRGRAPHSVVQSGHVSSVVGHPRRGRRSRMAASPRTSPQTGRRYTRVGPFAGSCGHVSKTSGISSPSVGNRRDRQPSTTDATRGISPIAAGRAGAARDRQHMPDAREDCSPPSGAVKRPARRRTQVRSRRSRSPGCPLSCAQSASFRHPSHDDASLLLITGRDRRKSALGARIERGASRRRFTRESHQHTAVHQLTRSGIRTMASLAHGARQCCTYRHGPCPARE